MSATTQITNEELAERIGVHPTMASRLLNGHRLPSLKLTERIGLEYGISWEELLDARGQGSEVLSALLRERCQPVPPSQRPTPAPA